jgi:hopanoid biosynthesis associated radical SAM protein HpnH
MGVPLRQMLRVGAYLVKQRLRGRDRFPLLVELEPLYACNLACAGCGKIQHPPEVLKRRLSVEDAVRGVVESGAPMVSIAGGEPLIHPEIHEMVEALLARGKFVYLCSNGLLMRRKLHLFRPSPRFAWVVHVDGLRERHDAAVCRRGVFDECVAAIRAARAAGFRVATNTTFFSSDTPETVRETLDFLNDELGVDHMMISPGYAYEKAPDPGGFLPVEQSRKLFREAFAGGRRRRWRLSHSPLFLDFLEGRRELACTAWSIPSFSIFGWQRPCYLMSDGHAASYAELLETTDWGRYGRGRDPRCANCLAHCGYEPTAVMESARSLPEALRALWASL